MGRNLIFSHQSKVDKEKGKGKGKETQEALAFSGGKALGPLGLSSNRMGFCLLPKITVENAGIRFSLQRDLQTGLDLYTIAKKKTCRENKNTPSLLGKRSMDPILNHMAHGMFCSSPKSLGPLSRSTDDLTLSTWLTPCGQLDWKSLNNMGIGGKVAAGQ